MYVAYFMLMCQIFEHQAVNTVYREIFALLNLYFRHFAGKSFANLCCKHVVGII